MMDEVSDKDLTPKLTKSYHNGQFKKGEPPDHTGEPAFLRGKSG
jgi:hypothetical protein